MHDERDRLDAELLAAGDYARLLAMYLPVVHDRVRARVRRPAADDVVQEIMLRLYRELHAGKAYPVPFRVVVHNVTGWLIGAHFEGRELAEPYDPDVHDRGVWDEDPTESSYLESLVERLPEGERSVFELRVLDGLSAARTAELLGMTPNAVDQALHRARKHLREWLVADG